MKAWDEVLSRLGQLDKVCPNPPDPDPSKETKPSKNLPSSSVEHSEHVQISEPLIPNKRVYQNEHIQQNKPNLQNKRVHQNEHVQSNEDKSVNFRRNSENSQNLNSRLFNMSESSTGPSKARWSHNQPSTSKPKNGWDHQPLLPQQSKQRPNIQAKTISE